MESPYSEGIQWLNLSKRQWKWRLNCCHFVPVDR